jgi:hypothetical protein
LAFAPVHPKENGRARHRFPVPAGRTGALAAGFGNPAEDRAKSQVCDSVGGKERSGTLPIDLQTWRNEKGPPNEILRVRLLRVCRSLDFVIADAPGAFAIARAPTPDLC